MKFQNPSLNFFLNGQTHAQTHARISQNQYAPHFFKVGGIKIQNKLHVKPSYVVPLVIYMLICVFVVCIGMKHVFL